MINLIFNGTLFKDKLAIGRDDDLLFKLKKDLEFFKNITTNSLNKKSKLDKNIVLMGRKTFFSIPSNNRPLKGRINLILTNNKDLIKINKIPSNYELKDNTFYFITLDTFIKIYNYYNPNVFVIGGGEIYNLFLAGNFNLEKPSYIYFTHVKSSSNKNVVFTKENEPNCFINYFNWYYKLISYSELYTDTKVNVNYRILTYKLNKNFSEEYKYINYLNKLIYKGISRNNRTEFDSTSLFGNMISFDISQSIPLMTTKKISFSIILEELLWMCRGDTDAKILQNKNIHIWDGNTSREFLDKRGLQHYPEGILGPQYGFLWRHFGAKYHFSYGDTSKCDNSLIGGFDQFKYVENLLENDPFSRRIMITAWSPDKLKEQCLPSCHHTIQFYVTEENKQKYLSCMFIMRSSDQLALSFNCVGYTILTYILAKRHNMLPKELIYVSGDGHVYNNHINQLQLQLLNEPRPLPKLKLDDSIKYKDWNEITSNDFELIGYLPHPFIKMSMVV